MTADSLTLLANATVAASLAILGVALMRGKLRQWFGARIAYAFWLVVPLALIATLMPAGFEVSAPLERESFAPTVIENPGRDTTAATNTVTPKAAVASRTESSTPLIDKASWLVAFWAAGFFIAFAVQLGAHWHFVRRNRLSGGHGRIQRAARSDVAPSIIGFLKPYVVVPRNFVKQFTRMERGLILAHERAHLQAGDVPANVFALLLRSVFWFNPVAYIGHRLFRADQELACDERVMQQHGQHRRLYAETLLKSQLMTQGSPLGCAWGQADHPLKDRVARLSRKALPRGRKLLGVGVFALFAAFSSSVAWATLSSHVVTIVDDKEFFERDKDEVEREWRGKQDDKYDLDAAQGAALVNALLDRRYNHARALIDAGADVNYGLRGDGTPLIVATRRDKRDMMELLLEKGADLDGFVAGDGTALVVAARRNNIDAVRFLIERGADVNQPAPGDGNPLIMAARHGDLEMVKLLVDAGADVDGFVLGDETPLIGAVRQNRQEVVTYLIEQGADVNLRVPTGNGPGRAQYRSPMGQARHKGLPRMAQLLRDAGATPAVDRED